MMSLWDALRMNMMISYQELVRTFPNSYQELNFKARMESPSKDATPGNVYAQADYKIAYE